MESKVVIGEDQLEMTRFFAYPRPAVFEAWTESSQLEKWWGCRETEKVSSEIDLRVGGKFKHIMHMKNMGDMVYAGVYEELVVPEKIVTSCIMGEGTEYAFESKTTVEFFEEDGGTRIKLTQVGLPPMPDPGKIITGGFNDAFDKLDQHLAA